MTDIPLRDYLQDKIDAVDKRLCQKIASQDKALQVALANSREAVTKAEAAIGERLTLLNESRRTIADNTAAFLPRSEYTAAHKELSIRIEALERAMAKAAGQQSVWIAFGTSGIAMILAVIDIALRLGAAK